MLWQEFLELKKNGESMIDFLNKVDNIVFKGQSADKKISDNLKIAIVFKELPQKNDSFIAALQFQQISYLQLKERLIERSLEGSSNKQDTSSTSIAAPAIHRTGHRGQYNGGPGQGNKKILNSTKCGCKNHTADRSYAKQHVSKQKSSNRFSGWFLLVCTNCNFKWVDGYCDRLWMHETYHFRQTKAQEVFYAGRGRKCDVYY